MHRSVLYDLGRVDRFSILDVGEVSDFVDGGKGLKAEEGQVEFENIETSGLDLRQIVMPLVVILCKTPSQV